MRVITLIWLWLLTDYSGEGVVSFTNFLSLPSALQNLVVSETITQRQQKPETKYFRELPFDTSKRIVAKNCLYLNKKFILSQLRYPIRKTTLVNENVLIMAMLFKLRNELS